MAHYSAGVLSKADQRPQQETIADLLSSIAEQKAILEHKLAQARAAREELMGSRERLATTMHSIGRCRFLGADTNHEQTEARMKVDGLSPRERQVLKLIAEGRSTKEVAAVLGISFKTAVTHRTNLLKKLGEHESTALVRIAIRAGMIAA